MKKKFILFTLWGLIPLLHSIGWAQSEPSVLTGQYSFHEEIQVDSLLQERLVHSEAEAAVLEGEDFVCVERSAKYICTRRLQNQALPLNLSQKLNDQMKALKFRFYFALAPLEMVWDMGFFKQWLSDQKLIITEGTTELYFSEVIYLWQKNQYSVIPGSDVSQMGHLRLYFSSVEDQLYIEHTEKVILSENSMDRWMVRAFFKRSEPPDSFDFSKSQPELTRF